MKRRPASQPRAAILTVAALGSRGEGIVETPDGPAYLPGAAPGDVVRLSYRPARKGGIEVTSWNITTEGASRRKPPCPHFGRCGGCALQHLREDVYAEWVGLRVSRALNSQQLSAFAGRIRPPVISPPFSRRRLVLHALRSGGRVRLGLYGRRSHELVDLHECLIARPPLWRAVQALRPLLAEIMDAAPLTITAAETDTGIDLLLAGAAPPRPPAVERLRVFAQAQQIAALSWSDGGRPQRLVAPGEPMLTLGRCRVPLPAGGFLQPTKEGEAALQQAVRDWTPGGARLIDLFAGVGTLCLPLADRMARILAVEGERRLVEAMNTAVAAAGLGERVKTLHRDLFRAPLTPRELAGADAVVVDPPRAGAKAQTAAIAASAVSRVILISCNPNTWARDLRILVDAGFKPVEIRPIAQFLYAHHVEVAALLIREGRRAAP